MPSQIEIVTKFREGKVQSRGYVPQTGIVDIVLLYVTVEEAEWPFLGGEGSTLDICITLIGVWIMLMRLVAISVGAFAWCLFQRHVPSISFTALACTVHLFHWPLNRQSPIWPAVCPRQHCCLTLWKYDGKEEKYIDPSKTLSKDNHQ